MGQSWLTFGPLMPENSRLCRHSATGYLLTHHHLPLIFSFSSLCPFQILPGGRRRRVSVRRRAVMGLVMWRVCTHTTAACPGVLTKTESHLRVGPTAWMSCCTENTPSFKKLKIITVWQVISANVVLQSEVVGCGFNRTIISQRWWSWTSAGGAEDPQIFCALVN